MLTLLTFEPALGTRCPSPFGVKADALLTMSGLPYRKEFGDILKTPRRKLPVLQTGSTVIPDSAHIQTYLESERGVNFDGTLNSSGRAIASSFRRMIEHHLYFLIVHFRWMEHGEAMKRGFFDAVPAPLRGIIFRKVQKNIANTLHLQGLGRHNREELIEFFEQDLQALSDQLDGRPFLMGDAATSIDASLYGALHNIIECELDTPGRAAALRHDNLVAYCERFRQNVLHD
jgi:glutathione S-transferase